MQSAVWPHSFSLLSTAILSSLRFNHGSAVSYPETLGENEEHEPVSRNMVPMHADARCIDVQPP